MRLRGELLLTALLVIGAAACGGSSNGPVETAAHRPLPVRVSGAPVPASLSALMLRPADLGSTWRYRNILGVEMKPEATPAPGQETGETSRAQVMLWASHWGGTKWLGDADVIEYAVTYDTAAEATRALHDSGWPAVEIAGHRVWVSPAHSGAAGAVFAQSPTTLIQLVIGHSADPAPGTLTTRAILRAAVHRAFAG